MENILDRETVFSEEEEKNEEAISYKEISCSSFEEAVEKVVAEENYNRIILCDIDGVLFGNKDKIPLYSLIKKSEIEDQTQGYLWNLREIYGDRVVIVTNRNPRLNLFLSSRYLINKTEEVKENNGPELKVFHSLLKQVPFLARKEKEKFLEYAGSILPHNRELLITSIEDWSVVSLNRKSFLINISKELSKRYGIKSGIINYVIKK